MIQNESFGYNNGMSRDDSFMTVPLPNSAITNSAFSMVPSTVSVGTKVPPVSTKYAHKPSFLKLNRLLQGSEMTPVTPFAIETAAEKTQVRLCGDVVVSLKLKVPAFFYKIFSKSFFT